MADVHILIVEDERGISEPLESHLAREGFISAVAPTIEEARAAFLTDPPDLVLLDVMLPDGDGRDLCREFRGCSDVPIVMLTARGEDVDKIIGLELGADDYVVKPFSAGELVASIRAILRRGRARTREPAIEIGDDPARGGRPRCDEVGRAGHVGGAGVRPPGPPDAQRGSGPPVASRSWTRSGTPTGSDPPRRWTCTSAWLRKKLEDDPSHPRYITTIRGVGFRFAAPDDVANAIEPG